MKKVYIGILALTIPALVCAQDLTTEITVDRTILPEQRGAERPSFFVPSVQLPKVELKPLALHEYLNASELTTIVPVLEPASYGDTIPVTPYRGYASVAYFPVYNLGASAGYRFINNHNTRLGAWMQFNGKSYGAGEATGVKLSDNTVSAGADFNRLFSVGHLGVSARYEYGRTGIPVVYDGYSQHANDINAKVSWWGRAARFVYNAAFDFEYFDFNGAVSDLRYRAEAGLMFRGGAPGPSGGLQIKGDFLGTRAGVLSLLPYYNYTAGNFTAHVGILLDINTRKLSVEGDPSFSHSSFHVAPDVKLGWTPADVFGIELQVSGGEKLNSAAEYYRWSHFITPQMMLPYSNVPVDAMIKFVVGPVAGASVELFGGYSMATNWLMPSYVGSGAAAVSGHVRGDFFNYSDIKGWLAGVAVAYRWRDMVDFRAEAKMAPQEADRAYYLWLDRAQYVVDGSVKVHPIDNLDIDLSYEFRGRRMVYGADATTCKLGNKSSLDLGAAYRINPAFTVWARGENLLDRSYRLLPGISAQGITGLVGVSYKF